ncbi:hypothetical protein LE181_25710 [Streptomyces sp. SCA3-4]|uniref:hypothetical protein n=1 Tax=Streptomyces sichuanensis TaxID=2871810 RepID=UPI001CE2E4FB|nr:hypothetical protein [Streptomyces sichuanensis]MCA6095547.1 hypothetical protein [Streptomyces sichuanensis]
MGAGFGLLFIPLALYFVLAQTLCRKLAAHTTPAVTWMFRTGLLGLPGGLIVAWWLTKVVAQSGS